MNGQLKALRGRNKADREKIRRSNKTGQISSNVEAKFNQLMEKIGEAKRRKIQAEEQQIMELHRGSQRGTIAQAIGEP